MDDRSPDIAGALAAAPKAMLLIIATSSSPTPTSSPAISSGRDRIKRKVVDGGGTVGAAKSLLSFTITNLHGDDKGDQAPKLGLRVTVMVKECASSGFVGS